jgi:hypothetical protein
MKCTYGNWILGYTCAFIVPATNGNVTKPLWSGAARLALGAPSEGGTEWLFLIKKGSSYPGDAEVFVKVHHCAYPKPVNSVWRSLSKASWKVQMKGKPVSQTTDIVSSLISLGSDLKQGKTLGWGQLYMKRVRSETGIVSGGMLVWLMFRLKLIQMQNVFASLAFDFKTGELKTLWLLISKPHINQKLTLFPTAGYVHSYSKCRTYLLHWPLTSRLEN